MEVLGIRCSFRQKLLYRVNYLLSAMDVRLMNLLHILTSSSVIHEFRYILNKI